MAGPVCKMCRGPVTVGKFCSLCRQPVCGDHRRKVGSGGTKTYYCHPPCNGQGGAPGYPSPYAHAQAHRQQQQPYMQQHQQQQHSQYPAFQYQQAGSSAGNSSASSAAQHPAAFGSGASFVPPPPQHRPPSVQHQQRPAEQAPAQAAGSWWAEQGGSSPNPPSSTASPAAAGSPYQQQAWPPQPQLQAASPMAQEERRQPRASPAEDHAAAQEQYELMLKFGPGAGDPLPTVPATDADGIITVQFGNGTPCTVQDSKPALAELYDRVGLTKGPRKSEAAKFLTGESEVRRGVVVGAHQGSVVVLERRRAPGGGFTAAATVVPPSQLRTLEALQLGKCRHCGCLIPLDESRLHVDAIHKTSASATTRIDTTHGVCVGNVELLLSLQPIRKLGEGAQGQVLQCEAPSGVPVDAEVKMPYYVRKDVRCSSEAEAVARYQQSVRLMALRHDHIIRYLAVQRTADNSVVRVVMPYYDEKDLNHTISKATGKLKEDWICSVILQLSRALHYLHSHTPPILHGDLKPDNVMLFNKKNQVILMDFDTAVEMSQHHHDGGNSEITMEWAAPEAAASRGARVTINSDVWSLGAIAFVLAVLPDFPMLTSRSGEQRLLNSEDWEPEDLRACASAAMQQRGYSRGFVDLVADMMAKDPGRRPGAGAVADRVTALMEAALLGGAM